MLCEEFFFNYLDSTVLMIFSKIIIGNMSENTILIISLQEKFSIN